MLTNRTDTLRVVIAPDSFKECLAAEQVAQAIARGWRQAAPDDQLVTVPLADGGEGTTRALTEARRGQLHTVKVTGPMGELVSAHYGLVNDGEIAIVEVAEASGLHCVPARSRNALTASSVGTGELILAALEHKPKTLIMGSAAAPPPMVALAYCKPSGHVFWITVATPYRAAVTAWQNWPAWTWPQLWIDWPG